MLIFFYVPVQVFGAKRSMLDDIAQAPVSAVEAATAAGPSSDEPVADVTAGTCTPSFPDATPTNFSSVRDLLL